MTIKTLVAFVLLLGAVSLTAQELTIFDLNDFVDPRSLGAVATSKGRFICPCSELLVSRVVLGWDQNFVNVTSASPVDVAFAHVAMSYYRGAWQGNAKVSVLRDVSSPGDEDFVIISPASNVPPSATSAVPRQALALQLARYSENGSGTKNPFVGRTQITWRISHYRETNADGRATEDKLRHEFGVEWDIPDSRVGSLGSVTYSLIGGESPYLALGKKQSRLAYVYRLRSQSLGPVSFEGTLSAGVLGHSLNFGQFRQLTLQPSVRASLPLGRTGINVNARFAPTWQRLPQPTGNDDHWQQTPEFAIFLDRLIFNRTRLRAPAVAE